jgi:hypothetical protein
MQIVDIGYANKTWYMIKHTFKACIAMEVNTYVIYKISHQMHDVVAASRMNPEQVPNE